jgi:hypothetical protein
MSAIREEKVEDCDCDSFLDDFLVMIILTLVFVSFINWLIPDTKAEQALASYKDAVELCGEDNVHRTDYTNGSTDFSCQDYAKAK